MKLDQFLDGLERASDLTATVVETPSGPGAGDAGTVVGEMTIAAGQVQAGASGYGLGADCQAIANVVRASAANAAAAASGTP